jgi:hypothetical protein
MDAAIPFALKTKEYPKTPGGPYRQQCPARGPSQSVTCPRAEACESAAQTERHGPVPATIDLNNRRQRASARAGLPRVNPADTPRDYWPKICTSSSVTTHQDEHAKHRQALLHGSTPWVNAYRRIRNQNEGGNGVLKSTDVDIDAADRRKPRGTAAQIIMIAIQIAVANLQRIDLWLQEQRESASDAPPPASAPQDTDTTAAEGSAGEADINSTEPRPHDRR